MTNGLARVVRTPDGEIHLLLGDAERTLLRTVVRREAGHITSDQPTADTKRLFPPAHPDDPAAEAEFRDLARHSLVDGRRNRLGIVEQTLDATRLDERQAEAWLGVLADLRLILGTRLGVTEDLDELPPERDPRHLPLLEYLYLGWLEERFVEALAAGLG